MADYHLNAPIKREQLLKLRIGDRVSVSGPAFTCRSKFQRAVFDEQTPMPESLKSYEILIHAGPIVISEPEGYRLVSFMPTSSKRFEKWGARSIQEWGLRIIIGKTTMGAETMAAMRQFGCVHLTPRSVSPNIWCDSISISGVDLLEEMGSIEAPWQLHLDHLGPFVVDIDAEGNNLFDDLDREIAARQQLAYRKLGIPDDFKPTKLYG
ncbi:MAG: fumarate hydratase C-terminal domain-containing protein [Bacillota bacterium]|nr:fumarate hydratase C-terminal domain-containing protein [Bacillota bacterium]